MIQVRGDPKEIERGVQRAKVGIRSGGREEEDAEGCTKPRTRRVVTYA